MPSGARPRSRARAPRCPVRRGLPRARRGAASRACGDRARNRQVLALSLTDLARDEPAMPSSSNCCSAQSTSGGRACAALNMAARFFHQWPASVGTWTFSATVRSSKSSSDWKVRANLHCVRRCADRLFNEISEKRMDPAAIGTNPVTASMNVVLPAPFGPMSPTMPLSGTVSVTPSSARRPPKRTTRSSTSSRFASVAALTISLRPWGLPRRGWRGRRRPPAAGRPRAASGLRAWRARDGRRGHQGRGST